MYLFQGEKGMCGELPTAWMGPTHSWPMVVGVRAAPVRRRERMPGVREEVVTLILFFFFGVGGREVLVMGMLWCCGEEL